MSNFLRKNTDGKKLLERMDKENHIPLHILEQCSNIKVSYQNNIWEKISGARKGFSRRNYYSVLLGSIGEDV